MFTLLARTFGHLDWVSRDYIFFIWQDVKGLHFLHLTECQGTVFSSTDWVSRDCIFFIWKYVKILYFLHLTGCQGTAFISSDWVSRDCIFFNWQDVKGLHFLQQTGCKGTVFSLSDWVSRDCIFFIWLSVKGLYFNSYMPESPQQNFLCNTFLKRDKFFQFSSFSRFFTHVTFIKKCHNCQIEISIIIVKTQAQTVPLWIDTL